MEVWPRSPAGLWVQVNKRGLRHFKAVDSEISVPFKQLKEEMKTKHLLSKLNETHKNMTK